MHVATTPSTKGHDIWQSASTGHQVSEAGGKSVSYNEARLAKLQAQFPPSRPAGLKRKRVPSDEQDTNESEVMQTQERTSEHIPLFHYEASNNTYHPVPATLSYKSTSGLFSGCVFYLDGYMGPTMSDHSLRRLLTQHGGKLSLYLQKTRITHVLLSSKGALANSKIRREVEGLRNRAKFVKVDWVFKCLEVGKRVGEWDFLADRLTGNNRSVAVMLQGNASATSKTEDTSSVRPAKHKESSEDMDRIEKDRLDLLDAEEGERVDSLER